MFTALKRLLSKEKTRTNEPKADDEVRQLFTTHWDSPTEND